MDINPVVIHWASPVKPWQDNKQPFASDYFDFAKLTPYYYELQIESIYKFRKNVETKPCKLKLVNKNRFLFYGKNNNSQQRLTNFPVNL